MQKEEQVSFLAEKIRQADAVLIGGGSGLSSAAMNNSSKNVKGRFQSIPLLEIL